MRIPLTTILFLQASSVFGQITLSNTSGASILARPLTLLDKTAILERSDGNRFDVPLTTFAKASQAEIKQHIITRWSSYGVNIPPEATPWNDERLARIADISFVPDGIQTKKLVLLDRIGDNFYSPNCLEMDMTSLTITQAGPHTLDFQISFSKEIPAPSSFKQPYILWIGLNIDGDEKTGFTEKDGIGQEVSISLRGWQRAQSWEGRVVPMNKAGKEADLKIDRLVYVNKTLSFRLSSKALNPDHLLFFNIMSCADGGTNVDEFQSTKRPLAFAFTKPVFLRMVHEFLQAEGSSP